MSQDNLTQASQSFLRIVIPVALASLVSFGVGIVIGTEFHRQDTQRLEKIIDLDSQILEKSQKYMQTQADTVNIAGDLVQGYSTQSMTPSEADHQVEQIVELGKTAKSYEFQMSLLFAQKEAVLNGN